MQSSESRREERRARPPATAGLSLQPPSDLTAEPSDQDLSHYGLASEIPPENAPTASAAPSPHPLDASMRSSAGGGSLNLTGRRIPRSLARALRGGTGTGTGTGSSVDGTSDQAAHSHYSKLGGLTTPRSQGRGGLRGARASSSPVKGMKAGPRADIHLVGELEGASGFTNPIHLSGALYCKWQVLYDPVSWVRVKGVDQGTTQACHQAPSKPEEDLVVWGHPIDLHLQTQASPCSLTYNTCSPLFPTLPSSILTDNAMTV
jgi:hypothetical protein